MLYSIIIIVVGLYAEVLCDVSNDKNIYYTLCSCLFEYFEVSRSPVLYNKTLPCPDESSKSSETYAVKGTVYVYTCHRCHESCYGCHGPTNGDCDQCSTNYLKASNIVHTNKTSDGNGLATREQTASKRSVRRTLDEVFTSGYSEDELYNTKTENKNDVETFVQDLSEEQLLPVDVPDTGILFSESDLGSGLTEETESITITLDKVFTTESELLRNSISREDRSIGTLDPQIDDFTTPGIELYESTSSKARIRFSDFSDIDEDVLFTQSRSSATIDETTEREWTSESTMPLSEKSIRMSTTEVPPLELSTARTTIIRKTKFPTVMPTTPIPTPETTTTTMVTSTAAILPLTSGTERLRTMSTGKRRIFSTIPTTTVTSDVSILDDIDSSTEKPIQSFWCVTVCPNGTYPDADGAVCQPCDSKCKTCVGPTFMNCTSCADSAFRNSEYASVSRNPKIVSCLSSCHGNEFSSNGTCFPCHEYCDGCTGPGATKCHRCRHKLPEHKTSEHHSNGHHECPGPDEDLPSMLEVILPLAFVLFLVIVTIGICFRWNGYFKKICEAPVKLFKSCHCPRKKSEEPDSLRKQFALAKARNEYTSGPPGCAKCCPDITEDGYELPLQPQPGTSGINAKDSVGSVSDTNSIRSSTRSIRPRRNDPLPPTPLEMRATERKNSYLYDYYVNHPFSKRKDLQKTPVTVDVEAEPASNASAQNASSKVTTNGHYANSERLYANC